MGDGDDEDDEVDGEDGIVCCDDNETRFSPLLTRCVSPMCGE